MNESLQGKTPLGQGGLASWCEAVHGVTESQTQLSD